MKALKVIGGFFGLLAIAALVFYLGWMRAPSPADVCANVNKLLVKEGGQAMPADKCEKEFKAPQYGMLKYAKQMKCARDASSMAELGKCEGR